MITSRREKYGDLEVTTEHGKKEDRTLPREQGRLARFVEGYTGEFNNSYMVHAVDGVMRG